MSLLDAKEQKHVRTAMRYLRARLESWESVGAALKFSPVTLQKILYRVQPVTPRLAFNIARLLDVSIDGLLAGQAVPVGTCPHCGRTPDFSDDGRHQRPPRPHPQARQVASPRPLRQRNLIPSPNAR